MVSIGLHSRQPIYWEVLEKRIRANGQCPHIDSSYSEVEVCYGDSNWPMDKFWMHVETFQRLLLSSGLAIDRIQLLVDTQRYKKPMIIIQN